MIKITGKDRSVFVSGDIEAQFEFSQADIRIGIESKMYIANSFGRLIFATLDFSGVHLAVSEVVGARDDPFTISHDDEGHSVLIFENTPAWILSANHDHDMEESPLAVRESSEHTFIGSHKVEITERRGEYMLYNREHGIRIHDVVLEDGMKEMEKELKKAEGKT